MRFSDFRLRFDGGLVREGSMRYLHCLHFAGLSRGRRGVHFGWNESLQPGLDSGKYCIKISVRTGLRLRRRFCGWRTAHASLARLRRLIFMHDFLLPDSPIMVCSMRSYGIHVYRSCFGMHGVPRTRRNECGLLQLCPSLDCLSSR